MKHRVNKFNFKGGKDANDMMVRKLAYNFMAHGMMVTTEKKGKAISSYMGRLVEKAKTKTEANKNYLLRVTGSQKVINNLFNNIGPTFKDTVGGYITLQRLQQRISDGAMMVKISWIKPIVVEEVIKEIKTAQATPKEVQAKKETAKTVKKAPVKKAVKKTK
ncbi:MAG: L17 family ribosomal protein [Patescibacteria group bacterium]